MSPARIASRRLRVRLWVAGELVVREYLYRDDAETAAFRHQTIIARAELQGKPYFLEISDPLKQIPPITEGDRKAKGARR